MALLQQDRISQETGFLFEALYEKPGFWFKFLIQSKTSDRPFVVTTLVANDLVVGSEGFVSSGFCNGFNGWVVGGAIALKVLR